MDLTDRAYLQLAPQWTCNTTVGWSIPMPATAPSSNNARIGILRVPADAPGVVTESLARTVASGQS